MKQQVLNNQAEAAELERRGQAVPAALSKTLADLRHEVSTTEQQIGRRLVELDDVDAAYERDKERFSQLETVLRRRSYSRQSEPRD